MAKRFQFSLRTLLLIVTVATILIAIEASYPPFLLVIFWGIIWFLFETGIVFEILFAPLSHLVSRIPFHGTILAASFAFVSSTIGGILFWLGIENFATFRVWFGLWLFAALFFGFGWLCIRATWIVYERESNGQNGSKELPTASEDDD